MLHQYLQMYEHLKLSFADNYLDPALVMPILLYAVHWERRILLKDEQITLSYSEILAYFLLIVVFGEIIFPLMSDKFTADYWDILAYALGTFAYIGAKRASDVAKRSIQKK